MTDGPRRERGRPPRPEAVKAVTVYLPLRQHERLKLCAGGRPLTKAAAAIIEEWMAMNAEAIDRLQEAAAAVDRRVPRARKRS
jgi:hypothetical protein